MAPAFKIAKTQKASIMSNPPAAPQKNAFARAAALTAANDPRVAAYLSDPKSLVATITMAEIDKFHVGPSANQQSFAGIVVPKTDGKGVGRQPFALTPRKTDAEAFDDVAAFIAAIKIRDELIGAQPPIPDDTVQFKIDNVTIAVRADIIAYVEENIIGPGFGDTDIRRAFAYILHSSSPAATTYSETLLQTLPQQQMASLFNTAAAAIVLGHHSWSSIPNAIRPN